MLTGIKIAFIGGDARMIEVVRYVSDLDASTCLYGFEHMAQSFPDMRKEALTPEGLREADVIVLPVAGMDEDGHVQAQFADGPLTLDDSHFAAICSAAPVFTGIARPALAAAADRHGLALIRLMELDEVAILNSVPTAEGAIALAMQHTDITIHGSRSVVLGFGRCGMTLARSLAGLGARVRAGARKPADLARIVEMGLEPFLLRDIEGAVRDADILFNTVPAAVLTSDVLVRIPRSCVIIDIASAPGGTDFRFAERHGIKAVLAPSLPGMVAPKTAGRIIAQTMTRLIHEAFASGGMREWN